MPRAKVFRRWIVAWFAVGIVLSHGSVRAEGDDTRIAIRAFLAQASVPGLSGADLAVLRAFYGERGYAPAWEGSPDAESDAETLRAALANSASDGLDPASYRVGSPGYGTSAPLTVEEDIRLTSAALHYASDLRDGRPYLREIDDDVELPTDYFDATQALAAALQQHTLSSFLASLASPQPGYIALKNALARYSATAAQGGWPTISASATETRRGRELLLRRLSLEDDQVSSDEDISDALERFQKRHGLVPTGRLDEATRNALNVPASQRVLEIVANMERWRWMPRAFEARYVQVNVPSADLVLVANGSEILTSHVVVGKPGWPTPILRADATGVTVNPPWLVPSNIARREIYPKLAANPGYLRAHHMIYRAGGGIEQLPGRRNALGTIKLDLPNRFDVYLHDTPSKRLFAGADRAKSHGCVRVQEILPLAAYALTGDAISVSFLTSAVALGKTRYFPLSEPLPIYITYWTAFVDADGSVEFRPDVYDRDQRLLAALATGIRSQRVTAL